MIEADIKGIHLKFETSEELFSPNSIDKGTLAMLSLVDFESCDKVLDLGCGYGVVGILAAKLIGKEKVVMIDINEEAVKCSINNSAINGVEGIKIEKSNGFEKLEDKDFSKILSNPPYHTDFSVPKMFIEKGFNRLRIGGKMYMVTKRETWYKNKIKSIFGGVKVWNVDDYYVFVAEKRNLHYANIKK